MTVQQQELNRALGRVEGKLDLVLEKMLYVEQQALSFATLETVEKLETRLRRVEVMVASAGGLAAIVSLIVGLAVAVLKDRLVG